MALLALSGCRSSPNFVPVVELNPQQFVEFSTIDDLEQLIRKKRIKTVYYTNEYFVIDVNSVMYRLKSRGYKNFHDYKEGKLAIPEEYSIFKPGYPLKRKKTDGR